MGGACSDKKYITKFLSENLEERDHPENLGIDGMIIL
jgi:hypothetical protein